MLTLLSNLICRSLCETWVLHGTKAINVLLLPDIEIEASIAPGRAVRLVIQVFDTSDTSEQHPPWPLRYVV